MAERIVVLPGDGIGPEVTEQARRVLEAAGRQAGLEFDFEEHLIGGCSIDAHGTPLRDEVTEACRASRAVLLGAVGGPLGEAFQLRDDVLGAVGRVSLARADQRGG